MTETLAERGYVPEEHAPDPVISHGDPTPPGKVAIWLFLASEIMFFIGILGTYIILRSGSTTLFASHAEALSKPLAGLNTLVLIFSSLTMALAVDASAKGNRPRTTLCLLLTLLCAIGFMVIKAIEYGDKAAHHTMLVKGEAPLTVTADPGQNLYAVVTRQTPAGANETLAGEAFERTPKAPPPVRPLAKNADEAAKKKREADVKQFEQNKAAFEQARAELWARAAIPLPETRPGTYEVMIPAGPDRTSTFNVYAAGDRPAPTDKAAKTKTKTYGVNGNEMWVYDGHAHGHDENHDGKVDHYEFTGYRMPYPAGGSFDIHLVSEHDVKNASNAEHLEHVTIPAERITQNMVYGPWKNIFYSCYYALTGIHGLHVIGGIVPISFLLIQSLRGKLFPAQTEYTGLYWHFVDLVWIFLFPLLYLI